MMAVVVQKKRLEEIARNFEEEGDFLVVENIGQALSPVEVFHACSCRWLCMMHDVRSYYKLGPVQKWTWCRRRPVFATTLLERPWSATGILT